MAKAKAGVVGQAGQLVGQHAFRFAERTAIGPDAPLAFEERPRLGEGRDPLRLRGGGLAGQIAERSGQVEPHLGASHDEACSTIAAAS